MKKFFNDMKISLKDKYILSLSIIFGVLLAFNILVGGTVYKTCGIGTLFAEPMVAVKNLLIFIGLTIVAAFLGGFIFRFLSKAEFIKTD